MSAPALIHMKTFAPAETPHDGSATHHIPSSTYTSPSYRLPHASITRPRTFDDDVATMVEIDLEAPDPQTRTHNVCAEKSQLRRNFFGMEKVTIGGVLLRLLACIFTTGAAFGCTFAASVTYIVVGDKTGLVLPDPDGVSTPEQLHAAFIHATLIVSLYGSTVWYAAVAPITLVVALVRKKWRRDGRGFPGYIEYIGGLAVVCIPTAIFAILIGFFLSPVRHEEVAKLVVPDGLIGLFLAGVPLCVVYGVIMAKNPCRSVYIEWWNH